MSSTDTRISQFSWIRVIACLAIVLLHTLDNSLSYFADTVTAGESLAVRITTSLLMWAVPCFLMVTGALLLDPARRIPLSKLFGKYIRRVFTALVFFTFVFTLIKYAAGEKPDIFFSFLKDLWQCTSMSYLWYLYLMIGLYLMMPFYKMVADAASDGMLVMLTAVLLLFTSVIQLTDYAGMTSGFYIPTGVVYPAYLFIGYLLYRRNMSAGCAIALLAVCCAAAVILTVKFGASDVDMNGLTGYRSPFTAGMSAAVFSLMLRIKAPAGELVTGIDSCSFGIYLIHMLGVRLVMKELGFDPYAYGPFGFIGLTIVFFIGAYALTFAVRKLPGNLL